MPIKYWIAVLGAAVLAAAGLTALSLCACLLYGTGAARKRLALLLAVLAVVLGARHGGQAVLSSFGLGWRVWPRNGMVLCAAALIWAALGQAMKLIPELPQVKEGLKTLAGLCGGVTALALAGLVMLYLFLGAGERASALEGKRTVVESSGIFHESVYLYVNPLVHGELLYEWQD